MVESARWLAGIAAGVLALAAAAWVLVRTVRNAVKQDAASAGIFQGYGGLVQGLHSEVARLRAEIERLSQLTTAQMQRIIMLEHESRVARSDRLTLVEMLRQVKFTQEELLRNGSLKDRLLDIPTEIVTPSHWDAQ